MVSNFTTFLSMKIYHCCTEFISHVEEVPQNMYRIPSAEENIIMEVPQKIPIYACSATLDHNGISIIIFLRHRP